METKAMANQMLRMFVISGFTVLTVAASIRKEKTSEAVMKPSTNLGKRCQMTLALEPCCEEERALHQIERRKAARPSRTFWENLTMVPILEAASPMISVAATTEPVVSSVPPIQAPPTMSERPRVRTSQG